MSGKPAAGPPQERIYTGHDKGYPRGSVEASAHDRNVELTGIVKYGAQRAAAELAVAGLTGVRSIRDDIEIIHDPNPHDAVISAAWMAGGVFDVRDDLYVTG